jgi:predicted nucleic acid-binding protein
VTDALLDTSFVVGATSTLLELPQRSAVSVVTLGELHAGMLLARDEAERDRRRSVIAAVRAAYLPLPVDEHVAERYAELLALARSRKRSEKTPDLLIVATAAATERTLYTLDRKQATLARAAGVPVEAA